METRRLVIAIVVAFAVYFVADFFLRRYYGPPPGGATAPVTQAPEQQVGAGPTTGPATESVYDWQPAGTAGGSLTLGGGQNDNLKVELDQKGAAVARILLTARKDGRLVHRTGPRRAQENEPYELVRPVTDQLMGGAAHLSFVTDELRVNGQPFSLRDLIWSASRESESKVVFDAIQTNGDGPRLQVTKTYELLPDKPIVKLALTIRNLRDQPLTVQLKQDGATGIHKENMQWDMRRVLVAQRGAEGVSVGVSEQRSALLKATQSGTPRNLMAPEAGEFAWTVLANKFYGVFVRPLADESTQAAFVVAVNGRVSAAGRDDNPGDLVARLLTAETAVAPQQEVRYALEIYAGPKDPDVLAVVNPDYVDKNKLGYQIAQAQDVRCCTFQPLPQFMSWLLRTIERVVRNYGVAIIILVIIVRTCLHPLTVFQQKSMFRMQESMAKIQPKLAAIREKFPNDKVRQNQETMKLYAEEHVNPAAGMLGMLPLFLQMPILVALWTALNTDISLRNEPFMLWMVDLSAPDALYTFAGDGISIPIISWFFGSVKAFNLLPILMGVSMWLQQKYMPKPGMQARLDAAKKQPEQPKKAGAMSPEDQLRQQQMIAYMMSILFPLLFYRMPSGLTLYWMATNVFGICETLIIRKQLKHEKELRDKLGPQPVKPRKPGVMSRFFKHIAAQAEEIQKKADSVTDQKTGRSQRKKKK